MNPLGYVNLHWLRQALDWAAQEADTWLEAQDPKGFHWGELNFFDEYRFVNSGNVTLFYQHGMRPAFETFNPFQRVLVLDALATAICLDLPEVWNRGINRRTVSHYEREIELSPEPGHLFLQFYDLLAASYSHTLSEFQAAPWHDDAADRLELYRHVEVYP